MKSLKTDLPSPALAPHASKIENLNFHTFVLSFKLSNHRNPWNNTLAWTVCAALPGRGNGEGEGGQRLPLGGLQRCAVQPAGQSAVPARAARSAGCRGGTCGAAPGRSPTPDTAQHNNSAVEQCRAHLVIVCLFPEFYDLLVPGLPGKRALPRPAPGPPAVHHRLTGRAAARALESSLAHVLVLGEWPEPVFVFRTVFPVRRNPAIGTRDMSGTLHCNMQFNTIIECNPI